MDSLVERWLERLLKSRDEASRTEAFSALADALLADGEPTRQGLQVTALLLDHLESALAPELLLRLLLRLGLGDVASYYVCGADGVGTSALTLISVRAPTIERFLDHENPAVAAAAVALLSFQPELAESLEQRYLGMLSDNPPECLRLSLLLGLGVSSSVLEHDWSCWPDEEELLAGTARLLIETSSDLSAPPLDRVAATVALTYRLSRDCWQVPETVFDLLKLAPGETIIPGLGWDDDHFGRLVARVMESLEPEESACDEDPTEADCDCAALVERLRTEEHGERHPVIDDLTWLAVGDPDKWVFGYPSRLQGECHLVLCQAEDLIFSILEEGSYSEQISAAHLLSFLPDLAVAALEIIPDLLRNTTEPRVRASLVLALGYAAQANQSMEEDELFEPLLGRDEHWLVRTAAAIALGIWQREEVSYQVLEVLDQAAVRRTVVYRHFPWYSQGDMAGVCAFLRYKLIPLGKLFERMERREALGRPSTDALEAAHEAARRLFPPNSWRPDQPWLSSELSIQMRSTLSFFGEFGLPYDDLWAAAGLPTSTAFLRRFLGLVPLTPLDAMMSVTDSDGKSQYWPIWRVISGVLYGEVREQEFLEALGDTHSPDELLELAEQLALDPQPVWTRRGLWDFDHSADRDHRTRLLSLSAEVALSASQDLTSWAVRLVEVANGGTPAAVRTAYLALLTLVRQKHRQTKCEPRRLFKIFAPSGTRSIASGRVARRLHTSIMRSPRALPIARLGSHLDALVLNSLPTSDFESKVETARSSTTWNAMSSQPIAELESSLDLDQPPAQTFPVLLAEILEGLPIERRARLLSSQRLYVFSSIHNLSGQHYVWRAWDGWEVWQLCPTPAMARRVIEALERWEAKRANPELVPIPEECWGHVSDPTTGIREDDDLFPFQRAFEILVAYGPTICLPIVRQACLDGVIRERDFLEQVVDALESCDW